MHIYRWVLGAHKLSKLIFSHISQLFTAIAVIRHLVIATILFYSVRNSRSISHFVVQNTLIFVARW